MEGLISMKEQEILSERIQDLCKEKGISFYVLSYRSAVPITTLMHIVNCTTKNPGIFTIIKICNGLDISVKDFFDIKEFLDIAYDLD